jgi:hypothetical protein
MADVYLETLQPATNFDLVTLAEAKLALGIAVSDVSQDDNLKMQITIYSDYIATLCNRVFAKEKMSERWRDIQDDRIFVSHYPISKIDDIESVVRPDGTTLDADNYEIELRSGKIGIIGGGSEPITVIYTGGYSLPDEAPPALKQAALYALKFGRMQDAMMRPGLAGVRSLAHKESRVVYHDPNKAGISNVAFPPMGSAGATGLPSPYNVLLMHYVRLQV